MNQKCEVCSTWSTLNPLAYISEAKVGIWHLCVSRLGRLGPQAATSLNVTLPQGLQLHKVAFFIYFVKWFGVRVKAG